VADITYIRLKAEFVYLAVILDGFLSQSGGLGTGSNFGNSTDDRGAAQAIERRHPEPGLVHHSIEDYNTPRKNTQKSLRTTA